jgi:hypothetical protein
MEGSTGAGRRLPPTSGGPGARDGPSILRISSAYVRLAVGAQVRAGATRGGRAQAVSMAVLRCGIRLIALGSARSVGSTTPRGNVVRGEEFHLRIREWMVTA